MEFLFADWLTKPVWMWLAFLAIVVTLLVIDLGVLHREQREIEVKESLTLSAIYIALGLAFGGWVWWYMGETAGMQYVTGFVIEKSLAMDNVFVIAMIFTYFSVPRIYQHRVLFWGILGVIVLRAIMIGLGATIVSQYSWVLYIFAVFLIITGIQMWRNAEAEYDVASNPVLKWVRRRFNVTNELHGEKFWVQQPDPKSGKLAWFMTPLFLGANHGRGCRLGVCGGLGACDLCDHDRSVSSFTRRTSLQSLACVRFTSHWPRWCIVSNI